MISYRLINRTIQNKIIHPVLFNNLIKTYCSDSDNDNKKPKKKLNKNEKKLKGEEALEKLNVLLQKMIQDDTKVNTLNLAKPKGRERSKKTESDVLSAKKETVEQKIIFAAKDVAKTMKGNQKQIESELLSKLLNTSGEEEATSKNKSLNLSDVISGMKIDRTVKPEVNNEASRAHQVRQLLDRTSARPNVHSEKRAASKIPRKPKLAADGEIEKIDLFGAKPLGIFTKQDEVKKADNGLTTWDVLQERELRLAVTHPPENYFQEMILWTKQGKVWKFPIDNEQGMEEEQSVSFAEHIFLERHLEGWCPAKGPIRHFMELVCVGLSKNPYVSAQAKKEHIQWYQDYFLSKQELLQEIGAMPASVTSENVSKQIQ